MVNCSALHVIQMILQFYLQGFCITGILIDIQFLSWPSHTWIPYMSRYVIRQPFLFCSKEKLFFCYFNLLYPHSAFMFPVMFYIFYPVSSKMYIMTSVLQPMLCVSAVNPLLFSKVPALHHVMNIRKKIGTMLPYVRCPFRRTIQKGLGSRRYLLESNDFFALKDLVDLSKGPFSG